MESLQVSDQRVLRVFKLNALVLGGTAAGTSHPQELLKAVFNTAVRPYLYKIQDQIALFLQEKFKNENIVVEFDYDRITELETSMDVKATSAKTLYATGLASLNESRGLVGLPKVNEENADKHAYPSFLFGNNVAYIEDGEAPVGDSGTNTMPGSSDPQGGSADLPTTDENNSNNNGE